MTTFRSAWIALAPALVVGSFGTSAPTEKVRLSIATLHAAALTTPRAAGDSTDAPFIVVSVAGAKLGGSTVILRDSAARTIPLDGAIGARPLTELTLAAGDSVSVLVSVLENSVVRSATVPVSKEAAPAGARLDPAAVAEPFIRAGAHLIGSARMQLINEGGVIHWRRLECVASCSLLNGPAASALPAAGGQPAGATLELTGNGGTYHLALRASRTP